MRLGTLLAERLLYAPSLGFCMLLSLIAYELAKYVCGTISLLYNLYLGSGIGIINKTSDRKNDKSHGSANDKKLNSIVENYLSKYVPNESVKGFFSKSLYWIIILTIAVLYTSKTVRTIQHILFFSISRVIYIV